MTCLNKQTNGTGLQRRDTEPSSCRHILRWRRSKSCTENDGLGDARRVEQDRHVLLLLKEVEAGDGEKHAGCCDRVFGVLDGDGRENAAGERKEEERRVIRKAPCVLQWLFGN